MPLRPFQGLPERLIPLSLGDGSAKTVPELLQSLGRLPVEPGPFEDQTDRKDGEKEQQIEDPFRLDE